MLLGMLRGEDKSRRWKVYSSLNISYMLGATGRGCGIG